MRYWCRQCGKEVPDTEIVKYHSIGLQHKTCRSGRVTPIKEPPKEGK